MTGFYLGEQREQIRNFLNFLPLFSGFAFRMPIRDAGGKPRNADPDPKN